MECLIQYSSNVWNAIVTFIQKITDILKCSDISLIVLEISPIQLQISPFFCIDIQNSFEDICNSAKYRYLELN